MQQYFVAYFKQKQEQSQDHTLKKTQTQHFANYTFKLYLKMFNFLRKKHACSSSLTKTGHFLIIWNCTKKSFSAKSYVQLNNGSKLKH